MTYDEHHTKSSLRYQGLIHFFYGPPAEYGSNKDEWGESDPCTELGDYAVSSRRMTFPMIPSGLEAPARMPMSSGPVGRQFAVITSRPTEGS